MKQPRADAELLGLRFGYLVIKAVARKDSKNRYVLAQCDCGNEREIRLGDMRHTSSCGCVSWHIKHGMSDTKLYGVWQAMIKRCHSEKDDRYESYGGRGIHVCQEWRESFSAFLRDMGDRPARGMLERIDNNQGYSKENCRWATNKEQCRNKRNNRYVTAFGITASLADWIGDTKDNAYGRAKYHLNQGKSPEVVLFDGLTIAWG